MKKKQNSKTLVNKIAEYFKHLKELMSNYQTYDGNLPLIDE